MALFADTAGSTGGETFIQRQQRLQGQQTAATSGVPQATGQQTSPYQSPTPQQQPTQQASSQTAAPAPTGQASTPVQGDGKIPPPQPLPSVQAAPQPAPAPQPQNPGPQNTGALQGINLGSQPFSTYQAGQFQTQVNQPGALPGSYQGSQFSQFQNPNQQALNDAQQQLLQRLLQNPETLGPQQLAQLKEKQKEAALLQEQQGLQNAMQNAASRGTTNGGALAGIQRQLGADRATNVINSNRDLDLAAALQNRQDMTQALGAVESILGGQMSRASQGYQNVLQGQTTQADDTRNVSQDAIQRALAGNAQDLDASRLNLQKEGMQMDQNFQQFQTQRSAEDANLQRLLSQFGINEAVRGSGRADDQFGLQQELGRGGLALDMLRRGDQVDQFGKNLNLNYAQLDETQRQANNNLGFNYTQLNQQGQNDLISQIMRMVGGG
jgi:hypothetical protein